MMYWQAKAKGQYKAATKIHMYDINIFVATHLVQGPHQETKPGNKPFHGQWGYANKASNFGKYSYPCYAFFRCHGELHASSELQFAAKANLTMPDGSIVPSTLNGDWKGEFLGKGDCRVSLPLLVPLLEQIPAGAWAIVMGCGIVSADLLADREVVLSDALLWLAVAVWVVLVLRVVCLPGKVRRETMAPAVLGSVAATTVLGARFAAAGGHLLAASLLVLGAVSLAGLLPAVLTHLETPANGTAFLLSVAVQGVAVLSAELAVTYRDAWLLAIAAVAWLAGLALYVVVVARFDVRAVGTAAGDHWVAGGALAIGTLAAGKITASAAAMGEVPGWRDVLAGATLVLWGVAMAWLLVLIASEVRKPRLGYDVRRWATVFPVGMYAACGFSTGQVTAISGITGFARVWTWVAVGVTLVVLGGLVVRAFSTARETLI